MTDLLGKWDRASIEHRTTLERCQNRADHGMPHHAMADRVDLLHIVEDLYGKVGAAEARAREAEEDRDQAEQHIRCLLVDNHAPSYHQAARKNAEAWIDHRVHERREGKDSPTHMVRHRDGVPMCVLSKKELRKAARWDCPTPSTEPTCSKCREMVASGAGQ